MGFINHIISGSESNGTGTATVPPSEVERLLRAGRAGTSSMHEVLQALVKTKVFMLLQGNPENVISGVSMRPLVLNSTHGFPSVCIFTNQSFATELQQQHPDYCGGLEVEFRWVLENCPEGAGLVLNPGTDVSIELPPDKVPVFQQSVGNGEYE